MGFRTLLKGVFVGGAALSLTLATAASAGAGPIYWTNWTGGNTCTSGGNCFTGNGTITTPTTTVNVTYTNLQGIGFYYTGAGGETDFWQNNGGGRNDAISPYTSTTVDNSPTGTDMIALQYQGSQTLTFDQTIANPVFSFVSLNFNGYSFFNQDFTILSVGGTNGDACGYWGCGGATKNIVNLGGGNFAYELNWNNVGGSEPHGTIQFLGAFNTLTWNSQSNEYWNGFTVGVQGTAEEVFVTPEPATLVLLGLGLAGIAARVRRRNA